MNSHTGSMMRALNRLGMRHCWVSLIKGNLTEMEGWLDYEENYGGAWAGWRHFAVFVAQAEFDHKYGTVTAHPPPPPVTVVSVYVGTTKVHRHR